VGEAHCVHLPSLADGCGETTTCQHPSPTTQAGRQGHTLHAQGHNTQTARWRAVNEGECPSALQQAFGRPQSRFPQLPCNTYTPNTSTSNRPWLPPQGCAPPRRSSTVGCPPLTHTRTCHGTREGPSQRGTSPPQRSGCTTPVVSTIKHVPHKTRQLNQRQVTPRSDPRPRPGGECEDVRKREGSWSSTSTQALTSPVRDITCSVLERLQTRSWSRCRGKKLTEVTAQSTSMLGGGGPKVRIQSEVLKSHTCPWGENATGRQGGRVGHQSTPDEHTRLLPHDRVPTGRHACFTHTP
jgi:hypothetical protein